MTELSHRSGARTLIIHIGDHKTGTTTIQHALAQDRVTVAGARPFYGAPLNHNHLPKQALSVLDKTANFEAAHATFTTLAARMSQSDAGLCVVSAEEFEGFPPRKLRLILDRYFSALFDTIKIVAYVRPHIQRLLSNYTEETKIGYFDGDLETYTRQILSEKRFAYAPRFAAWQKEFGADFSVRPAIRSEMAEGSILNDLFITALGRVDIAVDPADSQNQSMCLEDLLRVKFFHAEMKGRRRPFHHSYGWTLQRLLETLPKPEGATRIAIHTSLAGQVAKEYHADAVQMDTTFFGAKPLMQQALQDGVRGACEAPQPASPAAAFSASELRSLTLSARLIDVFLENGANPWPSFLHNRRLDTLRRDDQ